MAISKNIREREIGVMANIVINATAPSAWASYLINGDSSGIDAQELAMANAWLDRLELPFPVSCEDAGFCWWHDAHVECPLGVYCQEYFFLIPS